MVTLFFAVFGLVIALMKDVPDIKGDSIFKIPSFSVKLGARTMFRFLIILYIFVNFIFHQLLSSQLINLSGFLGRYCISCCLLVPLLQLFYPLYIDS
jgi:homogentisate phytyltransferase/homogentisate geranylgeranyltransferase